MSPRHFAVRADRPRTAAARAGLLRGRRRLHARRRAADSATPTEVSYATIGDTPSSATRWRTWPTPARGSRHRDPPAQARHAGRGLRGGAGDRGAARRAQRARRGQRPRRCALRRELRRAVRPRGALPDRAVHRADAVDRRAVVRTGRGSVRRVARPNAGLLIDAIHFDRAGSVAREISASPRACASAVCTRPRNGRPTSTGCCTRRARAPAAGRRRPRPLEHLRRAAVGHAGRVEIPMERLAAFARARACARALGDAAAAPRADRRAHERGPGSARGVRRRLARDRAPACTCGTRPANRFHMPSPASGVACIPLRDRRRLEAHRHEAPVRRRAHAACSTTSQPTRTADSSAARARGSVKHVTAHRRVKVRGGLTCWCR